MESSEASNQLLKNKYDLHKQPEVDIAARHTQIHTGERVPQDPLARIGNYLNRFHEIIDRGGPEHREHNLDLIKGRFHSRYVLKPGEVSEGYFENQRRMAREQGHGDIEITSEMRSQLTEVIIADQTSSLDKWIDYLSSPDAPYSDAMKYFALRSVVGMAEYDKERGAFPQRSKGTTKPFPDLNREALAYVLDAVDKKYKGEHPDSSAAETEDGQEFEKLLAGESFPKLYAWAIEKVTPATSEELSGAKGEWVKYNQHTDPMPLVSSLQGHGTGWCTAGESTARTQLQGGDFYVYYSFDSEGRPTIPRAAIRMDGERIGEVRGIAPEQNLDGGVVPVVEEKLQEFPDGPSYKKKASDMKQLTAIENQATTGQELSASDLTFLYEIDTSIEGFGYDKDPRIAELRAQRNPEEDMPIVLGCDAAYIARSVAEIGEDTKAYVGPLTPGIFDKLPSTLEHVYTAFPEGKIRRERIEIGGKTTAVLEDELQQAGIYVSEYAKDMLHSKDFTTLPNAEMLDTVRLKVQDLGLPGNPTTDQIYARARDLGLDLTPAEAGPHLRLKYKDQPLYEWLFMGMKQISGRDGIPDVFSLYRRDDGL